MTKPKTYWLSPTGELIELLGGDINAETIVKALGFTPIDESKFAFLSDADPTALSVTDSVGNVIARVTPEKGVEGKVMTVNGKDVESGLLTDDEREAWNNKSDVDDILKKDDPTAFYVCDSALNILMKVSATEGIVGAIMNVNGKDVERGLVTDADRAYWSAKQEYIGDVFDKTDDTRFIFADKNGNILGYFGADGLHTTDVYIGNINDGERTVLQMIQDELAALVGAAPEALNTLYELAAAIQAHQDVTDLLTEAIGKKANDSDLTAHKTNPDVHIREGERDKWNTVEDKLPTATFTQHQTDYNAHKADYDSHAKVYKVDEASGFIIVDGDESSPKILFKLDALGNANVVALLVGGKETKQITGVNGNVILFADGTSIEFGATPDQIEQLAKLSSWYDGEHLKITSFTMSPSTTVYELGQKPEITLSWTIEGSPVALFLNGSAIGVATTSAKVNPTSTTTYTLKATGSAGVEKTISKSVSFYNRCYYGAEAGDNITAELIRSSLTIGTAKSREFEETFTVADAYIIYAYPKRLGTSVMSINGFIGSFKESSMTIPNAATGYSEEYLVYQTVNKITGTVTVKAE